MVWACGSCKLIAPFIKKSVNDNSDVVMLKVNVDECEEAAIQYNIPCPHLSL
ncbi:Thioredoxin domain,Thioredoxin-like fold [Cinara cedri]|uniref:Thioredoxin domain,Thioredoxin-like fold n=1 Tax=Cinara cedri TaxID=506608 RepID=A0A5E4MP02_9HEMI|nr:Thioredoxin domain,Thioredoxin-like fold [Cinara cedri]